MQNLETSLEEAKKRNVAHLDEVARLEDRVRELSIELTSINAQVDNFSHTVSCFSSTAVASYLIRKCPSCTSDVFCMWSMCLLIHWPCRKYYFKLHLYIWARQWIQTSQDTRNNIFSGNMTAVFCFSCVCLSIYPVVTYYKLTIFTNFRGSGVA